LASLKVLRVPVQQRQAGVEICQQDILQHDERNLQRQLEHLEKQMMCFDFQPRLEIQTIVEKSVGFEKQAMYFDIRTVSLEIQIERLTFRTEHRDYRPDHSEQTSPTLYSASWKLRDIVYGHSKQSNDLFALDKRTVTGAFLLAQKIISF